MGSGKSTISQYLRQVLQDSEGLDLDLDANREVNLDNALGREYVVAEMYDGGSHTSDPEWVAEFKDRGYNILSVILDATVETHIFRVLHRTMNQNTEHSVRHHYEIFHERLRTIFSNRAKVKEIALSTEDKKPEEVGQKILDYIGSGLHGSSN